MSDSDYKWHKLSVAQKDLMLFGISTKREDLVNMLGFHAFIKNDARLDILEKAWNMILEYHDALRLRIRGQIIKRQRVVPYEYETLPIVKVDGFEGLLELEQKERNNVVCMLNGPLYRVTLVDCGNGTGGMIACIHNIVVDGYSLGMIFEEMEAFYSAVYAGKEAVHPKKMYPYSAYIKYESKYFKSKEQKEDYKWWKKVYRGLKNYSMVLSRPSSDVNTNIKTVEIKGDDYQKFLEFCEKENCSVPSVVESIMALTTYRIKKKTCFCFYNLTHGRWTYAMKQTVGCISGCNPQFFNIDLNKNFKTMAKEDYSDYLEFLRHGRLAIAKHIWLAYWDSLKNFFNFHHNWMFFSPMELGGISSESRLGFECFDESELDNQFYSAVYNMPNCNILRIDLNYQTAKFSLEQIDTVVNVFIETFNWCINNPEESLLVLEK